MRVSNHKFRAVGLMLLLTICYTASGQEVLFSSSVTKDNHTYTYQIEYIDSDEPPALRDMYNHQFYGLEQDDSTALQIHSQLTLSEDQYVFVYDYRYEHYFLVPTHLVDTLTLAKQDLPDYRCFIFQPAPPISENYSGRLLSYFDTEPSVKMHNDLWLDLKPINHYGDRIKVFSISTIDHFILYSFRSDLYNINRRFLQFCWDGLSVMPLKDESEYYRVVYPVIRTHQQQSQPPQLNNIKYERISYHQFWYRSL